LHHYICEKWATGCLASVVRTKDRSNLGHPTHQYPNSFITSALEISIFTSKNI
jgi:hypothetical protein